VSEDRLYVVLRQDDEHAGAPTPGEVGAEDRFDDVMGRLVGDDAVDGAEVLFDVHRNAFPRVRIARVCVETHRRCRRLGRRL
jgi:hypothetical protein